MSIIIFLSISSFGKIFARSSKIEESIWPSVVCESSSFMIGTKFAPFWQRSGQKLAD
jgi:hypothetical protein